MCEPATVVHRQRCIISKVFGIHRKKNLHPLRTCVSVAWQGFMVAGAEPHVHIHTAQMALLQIFAFIIIQIWGLKIVFVKKH